MSTMKWGAIGALVAAFAAVLAFFGGPVAGAVLAALAVGLMMVLELRRDRHLGALRRLTAKSAENVERVCEQNRDLKSSIKELKSENAALAKQLAATRSALDAKIALAVQRIHERVKAEVQGLVLASQDAEVDAGLAALNRYAELAKRVVDPPAEDSVASDATPA